MHGTVARISLNARQAAFITACAGGLEPRFAAEQAGYSHPNDGNRLLRMPHIVAALDQELRRVLSTEAAPAAISFLVDVVKSPKYGERVRVDAAKTLLDRAGYVAPRLALGGDSKPVEDMSPDELRAFIRSAELALGDKAIVVSDQPLSSTLGDML